MHAHAHTYICYYGSIQDMVAMIRKNLTSTWAPVSAHIGRVSTTLGTMIYGLQDMVAVIYSVVTPSPLIRVRDKFFISCIV